MDNRPRVFINFRGKDLRRTFVPHLKYHLKHNNVNVFTDDDLTGKPLVNLLKYIRKSRIVIVIFSISYLESKWCLQELVQVRNCLNNKKLDFYVIPIFYKVRTSHVKDQTGDFGKKFLALRKKHPRLTIWAWKRALRSVAKSSGLTYEKESSLSELDFIYKIVKKTWWLNLLANTLQEEATKLIVSDVNHLNKLLHLSNTSEALNLERSLLKGFMIGFAWKDLISSMQICNSVEISHPAKSLQFHIDDQAKESLENAINWLALHMMSDQTQPALIFSNWDKLDRETKNNIIYFARKKSQTLKAYNEMLIGMTIQGDNSKPFSSHNIPLSGEVPTWDKTLDPKVPQDWPHRAHRRAMSFHDNRERVYPLPCKFMSWHRPENMMSD
ncbi:unnamed protein product [Arabis nemorensis]|uniref:TIR domain-containing protein n=1 Tax=Arabis nemorensis TaxID=586526 RepID=A0A565CE97_9BRAS|nr:unnamed protein product [Arabis nemorensis]